LQVCEVSKGFSLIWRSRLYCLLCTIIVEGEPSQSQIGRGGKNRSATSSRRRRRPELWGTLDDGRCAQDTGAWRSVGLTLRADNNATARIGLKRKPSTSIPISCCSSTRGRPACHLAALESVAPARPRPGPDGACIVRRCPTWCRSQSRCVARSTWPKATPSTLCRRHRRRGRKHSEDRTAG
jgi:hypothetical protein